MRSASSETKLQRGMRISKCLITLALGTLTVAQCGFAQGRSKAKDQENNNKFVATDTSWKNLSVREKIGQTMMVISKFYDQKKEGNGDMKEFMRKYPIGGFFIARWYFDNYQKEYNTTSEVLVADAMKEYNEASKYPLFFSEDFERGMGETYPKYTHMPAEMSIGAANDPELAYDFGKSIASEAKEMGFNWLLHPVCDLNMNPLQELVIERSISDDVNKAIPLLKKQMEGIHEQNVISTVKHFPGDGVTMRNQHIVTTANSLSEKEWKNTFGKMFNEMIGDGAASIMVGHIQLPFYQKEKINGQLPPATLSKELMVDLLKNKMKFNGVVITDALNMGGCAGYYKDELEVSVQCFAAGADIVLWPSLAYMDTIEARINRGVIPMSRLDDAVSRVWALRERFNLLQKKDSTALFTKMSNGTKNLVGATATKLADKAVTLVEDRNHDLPLNPKVSKKLLIVPVGHCLDDNKFALTKKEFEKRGFDVTMMVNPHFYDWGYRIDSLDVYDKIIVCFENRYFAPLGTPFFKDKESFGVWTVNMTDPKKRIAISYSNPFLTDFYEGLAPLKVNAYSCDPFSQEAVVKALCGEIPFVGKSPVKLNPDALK